MGFLIFFLTSLAFGQQTTTRIDVVYSGSTPGRIRGFEQGLPKGNYIDLIWPDSLAANYALTFPKETATLLATENHQFSASDPFTFATYRARGTEASPSDIFGSDSLGHWTGYGRVSAAYSQLAGIQLVAATTTTGSIDFWTHNGTAYAARINVSAAGHLYPYGSATQDVGDSTVRWRKGWFQDLDISGTCTGCGGAPPITWTLETNDDILTMQHHLASGAVARNILSQYSRGTNSSPSAALAGDAVWTEKWQYYAGGAYRDAGGVFVNVPSGATVSGTSSPGQVSIFGTKHAETAGTEVVRFGAQTFSETPNFGARFFATVYPSSSLTLDLGAAGVEWLTVWVKRISTTGSTNIEFYPGNALRWSMNASDFGSLLPATDSAAKIGSSTLKLHSVWSNAYHTSTHNSWGIQFNEWSADNSVYHRMTAYGTSYFPAAEYRKARGTIASPTAVSDGDTISWNLYEGYAPSGAFSFSGYIQTVVDGTPSGSVVPGSIRFGTMNAGGTVADRMRIRADGTVEMLGNVTISGTCTGCGSSTPPIDWYLNSGSTVLTLGNHGTVSASQLTSRFSRGSNASPTDAATNDLIGNHTFRYYAGGGYRDAAAIWVGIPASGVTISGSSSPAYIALFATQDGATSGSEVMRFGALGGSLGFGTMTGQKVIPSGNLTVDLGAFGAEWLTIWASRIRTSSSTAIDFYPGNTHRWTMTTGSGSLTPITDGGPSIGSEPTKANQIWARSFRSYTDSSYGTQQHDLYGDANLNLILTVFSGAAASDRASIQMHRYRGSKSSPAAVQALDQLGVIAFDGQSTSGLGVGATVRAYATLVGSGFVSADLHFQTTDTSGTLNTPFILRDSGEADFFYAVDAVSGFKFNGTAGANVTIPVRKADDSGSCTITVQGGIVTATTC